MSLENTPASISQASRVARLDSHAYGANFYNAYAVVSVPNGGYVATTILRAASLHLAARNQTDTVSAHWQFVKKSSIGEAILIVDDVKLGRGLSVLHITLYQGQLLQQHPWVSSKSTKTAAAYITNGNLDSETGFSLASGWTLGPTPPPPADLAKLAMGGDPNWIEWIHHLRPVIQFIRNMSIYRLREASPFPGTHDAWTRLANGDRWVQDDLGVVLDIGPPLHVASFHDPSDALLWYPTIVASLEIKKRLPVEGVEWLRYRVVCKSIKNGRYDAEVMIFDPEGDLVALSHHVAMVVGMERNTKTRPQVEARL